MEISDPVPEMIIPVTSGKRTLELRLRTRAECRELMRAAFLAGEQLPDDGKPGLMPDAVKRADPSMTPVQILEALAPMNPSQLRAVIVDAWGWQAAGVEQAISDVQARSAEPFRPAGPLTTGIDSEKWWCAGCGGQMIGGRTEDDRCPDCRRVAADRLHSVVTGTPLVVEDDEALPDCAGCGCSEVGHARADGQPIASGECRHRADCGCTAYQLPQDPALAEAEAATVIAAAPGNGEPCACGHHYGAHLYGHGGCLRVSCRCRRYRIASAAAQDEPDEAAILGAGELAAAEVNEARSRERPSDSAVGPLAEDEPHTPQEPDAGAAGRCPWWSDPSDDFYGRCIKDAGHDHEGASERESAHENAKGIQWHGKRWASASAPAGDGEAPLEAADIAYTKLHPDPYALAMRGMGPDPDEATP